MREASKARVKQANEDYNHILQNSPPSLLNWKELRDRRLPHAKKRLKIAKKQFKEAKVEAKEERKRVKERKPIKISLRSGNQQNPIFLSRKIEELKQERSQGCKRESKIY